MAKEKKEDKSNLKENSSFKEKITKLWKKFWYLIWEDESLLGWIFSLMFAFVTIKFVFFPALSFVFGTSMPLVVVESASMHHPGNFMLNYLGSDRLFIEWWQEFQERYQEFGIAQEQATNWPLKNGLEVGDVIVVWRANNLNLGDIIIFEGNQRYPIIHRIVYISEVNGKKVYSTKGDNNPGQLPVEQRIPEDAIIGKAIFRIPLIGWVKLIFVRILDLIR